MPLDQSFVGREYPPTWVYEISREKIKEFADAIGDSNPIYLDPEAARAAGHEDVIAPPTFATIVNTKKIYEVVSDPDLGFDSGRMIHGDQRFAFTRPLRVGDRLAVTMHIDKVDTRMGNDMLSLRAEIHSVTGEHLLTCAALLISLGGSA
ncbi:acyl dehydratase [Herbihabitans rhizosphaerae]|uniref:UPF0336 protein EV193_10313 n=1 Tax=Herbihabitans rhizosphaerae TaxID=1872711 RepID=A0A4Q7KVG7_9PSEU|nr:MaoC family dehydratase N-terminal domain-containing protein [Herbihabitans rhizosphaerae]RZS40704.1 acyl dehydratase [Herbihabitans rhizosphaerae]